MTKNNFTALIEGGVRPLLSRAQTTATLRGGFCLSLNFKKTTDKLLWKCKNEKHSPWEATYSNVVSHNKWCKSCHLENIRFSDSFLSKANDYAMTKGGQCLSVKYVNSKSPLLWKCSVSSHNPWERSYNRLVSSNSWCPECSSLYLTETRVKLFLNWVFSTDFKKTRPASNINPDTKHPMELDGFSESMKLAFEYQGEFHYFTAPKIGYLQENLEATQKRDAQKKNNCVKKGITLIVIPLIKEQSAQSFYETIRSSVEACVGFPKTKDESLSVLSDILDNSGSIYQKSQTTRAIEKAQSYNGEALTPYTSSKENITWKCSDNTHPEFELSFNAVMDLNRWCPLCCFQNNTEKANNIAEKRNGLFSGLIVKNKNEELNWFCNTHQRNFKLSFKKVNEQGRWCVECETPPTSVKPTIKSFKNPEEKLAVCNTIANSHGGKFLSKEWVGYKGYYEWKCHNPDHPSWVARYTSVCTDGHWCKDCGNELSGKKRKKQ